MILSTDAGLFGPYEKWEVMADRIRVWPTGSPANSIGADLPFAVIGSYVILEIPLPADFDVALYEWNGTELVRKQA